MTICKALSDTLSNRNAPKARPEDRENNRGEQAATAKNSLPHEPQGTAKAHEGQSQHVGCNRTVRLNAKQSSRER